MAGQELAGGEDSLTVREKLEIAVQLDPANVPILKSLAKLQNPGSAIDTYQRIVEIAPTDGMSWAMLFYHKLQQGQLDSGTRQALKEAVHLTPYEPAVQEVLLWAGTAHWEALDPELRNDLVLVAGRAMMSRAPFRKKEITAILKRGEIGQAACSLVQFRAALECAAL